MKKLSALFASYFFVSAVAAAATLDLKQSALGSGVIQVSINFDGTVLPIKLDTGASESQGHDRWCWDRIFTPPPTVVANKQVLPALQTIGFIASFLCRKEIFI